MSLLSGTDGDKRIRRYHFDRFPIVLPPLQGSEQHNGCSIWNAFFKESRRIIYRACFQLRDGNRPYSFLGLDILTGRGILAMRSHNYYRPIFSRRVFCRHIALWIKKPLLLLRQYPDDLVTKMYLKDICASPIGRKQRNRCLRLCIFRHCSAKSAIRKWRLLLSGVFFVVKKPHDIT